MSGFVPFPTMGRVDRSLTNVAAAPLGLALLTLLFACDANESAVTPASPDTISIDQPAVQLDIGSSTRLRLVPPAGDQGPELSGGAVVWTVQNPGVARVDAGVVTAVGEGATRVTAVVSGRPIAWADITVTAAPGTIEVLSSGELAGEVGQPLSERIRLFVKDQDGVPIRGADVAFEAHNGTVDPVNVRTDVEGIAESSWTLGPRAGSQVLDVRLTQQPGVRALIVAVGRPGEAVTIDVTPNDATINPGQDVKFTATPRDAYGNVVSDAEVVWSTTNPLVATVDTSGLAAASGSGDVEIEAVLVSDGTESAVTSLNAGAGRGKGRLKVDGSNGIPAQVRDLSAPEVTETTVTLRFTEIADGHKSPARYVVRYAVAAASMNFSAAQRVAHGSCAGHVQGQAVGSTLQCVVDGLDASTAYAFQVVAFRGSPGRGAVYGAHSNIASATTRSVATAASLEIASGNHQTAQPGQVLAQPVVARVRDASGASLPGIAVRWAPLNGSTSITKGVSDANGLVQVAWKLGTESGTQALKASTAGVAGAIANATAAAGKAATIEVAPSTASVTAGSTVQLTATARDALGNVLIGVIPNWTSSNATVASVSSSGVVSGVGAGDAVITAAADGAIGSHRVSVAAASPTSNRPATVTTLAVDSMRESRAYLKFTEVNDGRGHPAGYQIRYHLSPIGWNWGTATPVARGTCAGAVEGTKVGAVRTCTVEGLQPGVGYDFQMVSYRGKWGGEVVYSPSLSNIAQGVARAGGGGQLTIGPRSHSFSAIGETQKLTIEARGRSGASIPNPGAAWLSSNTAVATVDADGVVTARARGTAVISATATCCVTDAITVTVEQVVSSVEVAPSSASTRVKSSIRLAGRARDRLGHEIPGARFAWRSANTEVASIQADGSVYGVGAGSTTITATVNGVSGEASIAVTAESTGGGDGQGLNEPPGLRALTRPDWSVMPRKETETAPIIDRWFYVNRAGFLRSASDSGDPLSPSGVLDFVYPQGFTSGGTEPAALETPLPGFREMFVAFSFKLSENWYDHAARAGTPKIAFWWFPIGEGASNMFFLHRRLVDGGTSILEWGYTPANRARTDIRPGRWYTIQLYVKLPSVPGVTSDGIKRWWVNGQLDGEHTNLFKMNNDAPGTPNAALSMFHFAPTWGGVGGPTVPAEQYIRIGHTYISGR